MKLYKSILGLSIVSTSLMGCSNSNGKADGYGNFEATEVNVSVGNSGKLFQFDVNEGDELKKGAFIGYVDTIPLDLKRQQLKVSKAVISSKSKGVLSQIDVLNAKLKTAMTNKERAENLLKDNAGTQKQLDDINGEIDVLQQQKQSVEIQNAPTINEIKSIDVQVMEIEDLIHKSKIINPIDGTVLAKYAEATEIISTGRPLYKIADLSSMNLRVYVSERQLPDIKIGQEVTVKIDSKEDMKSYPGTITWIASEAEFTPKIIQTKDERVSLVYAVKIRVKNDGSLKIGMPAEMWLKN